MTNKADRIYDERRNLITSISYYENQPVNRPAYDEQIIKLRDRLAEVEAEMANAK